MSADITAHVLLRRNTDLKHELDIRSRHIALLRAYSIARRDIPTTMQLWSIFSP